MSDDAAALRKLVLDRTGIVLGPDKDYLIESRLLPLARCEGCTGIDQLLARVRNPAESELRRLAVEAMATHETLFMRDVTPFEALRESILREAAAQRSATSPVWIWSAACSTGQEPYSVAMLVREYLPDLVPRVKILATDFSGGALARARAGKYHQLEVNRGLPAALLVKYFRREGLDWQIGPQIRDAVEFRELNLLRPWPSLPTMDVILLRNVLIYFSVETKRTVLAKARGMLARHGTLFLGGSETVLGVDDQLERVQIGRATAYRRIP